MTTLWGYMTTIRRYDNIMGICDNNMGYDNITGDMTSLWGYRAETTVVNR